MSPEGGFMSDPPVGGDGRVVAEGAIVRQIVTATPQLVHEALVPHRIHRPAATLVVGSEVDPFGRSGG